MNEKHQQRHVEQEMVQAAINEHFSRQSRLTPRLKNWEEDLPENNEEQTVPGQLVQVTEINDIWMELPRYENIMWGGAWLGIISSIVPMVVMIYIGIDILSSEFDITLFLIMLLGLFFMLSMFLLNLRMALFVPRDQPIRFNRKRQKVYIFDYHRKQWNPWVKWPTTIKVFDWADIHGEISHESDRYDQGFRLYCAVCKPGTWDVAERFILSRALRHIVTQRKLWSHCCQYMQHKPVVMDPLEPGRPDNWKPRKNMCWSEDIDRESTTAPAPD